MVEASFAHNGAQKGGFALVTFDQRKPERPIRSEDSDDDAGKASPASQIDPMPVNRSTMIEDLRTIINMAGPQIRDCGCRNQIDPGIPLSYEVGV